MTNDFTSAYLNRPLRTKAQALRDMATQRSDANKIEGMEEYPESRVRVNGGSVFKRMNLMKTGAAHHFFRVSPGGRYR